MTTRRKITLLGALYLVQGLPFGFQATALPAWMRAAGMSLTGVGLLSALALPWLLKALWAPLVDRWWSPRLGRRKSWIVPLQALLAVTCAVAALVDVEQHVTVLLALVFLMNLLAATQDIAVDGLAVDLLHDGELGPGNAAQVVGYKVGMLAGGGLLVWASGWIGWSGLFLAMATTVAAVLVVVVLWEEPDLAGGETQVLPDIREVLRTVWRALSVPGGGWLVLFIATYKLGESLVDVMFKPFLIDLGHTPADIGLWLGTWGMAFSLLGSALGGLAAMRMPRVSAVGLTATLRLLPLLAEWWLARSAAAGALPSVDLIVAVTCAEHFFGGALTTTMFALMMARVDRTVGATHFTVLASIEALGKSPAAWASGPLAEALGYDGVFLLGCGLSAAFLGLLGPVGRRPPPSRPAARTPA